MMRGYRREVPTYFSIAVVTALCARIDIVMISNLLSIGLAGVYAAAARISDAALMVPTMAAIVMFPAQARLFEADPAGFGRLLSIAVRCCLIAGFASALLVIALSPSIIHWLYAPKLWPSAAVLQILILGTTLMVIDQLLSTTMLASHSQSHDLRAMSVGLAALVVLLAALTHRFGLLGSAAAVPAALLARVFYRLQWAERKFAIPFRFAAARVVAAAIIAVGLFFAHLGANWGMDLLLAWFVYMVALWTFGSVRGTDLRAVRGLIPLRWGLRP
jgi:O-antigen/teichoic acid export membrane protein